MNVHRTIRYRLHPNTQAKACRLHELAGACRFVWNHFVGVLRDEYEVYGRCDPRWYDLGPRFTRLRTQMPWLQDYSANIVKLSLKPIEVTYKQFWKGDGGLPKFHGKHTHAPSIPLAAGLFKIQGDWLHVQRIGQLKLSGNNPYPEGKPVSGTLRYKCNKWYAYIVYEIETTKTSENTKPMGIDRNVGQVARSDGIIHYTPDVTRLEARKRRYQRMMARRQCGNRKLGIKPSHRYLKAKNLHARTQQKIVQVRTDWCHQVSREIANEYNEVYLEGLNTRAMTKSAKGTQEHPGKHVKQKAGLNKSILDSGWSRLEHYLGYKSSVMKVNPAYTSQTCHVCGHTDKHNRKTRAYHECVACGHRDHADINAARNILAFGNGACGRGGGGVARPVKRQTDTEVQH